jgi:hypothetical protein
MENLINIPKVATISYYVKCMCQADESRYFVVYVCLKHQNQHDDNKVFQFYLSLGEAVILMSPNDCNGCYLDEFNEWQYPKYFQFDSIEACNEAISVFQLNPKFPREFYPLIFSKC